MEFVLSVYKTIIDTESKGSIWSISLNLVEDKQLPDVQNITLTLFLTLSLL